MAGGPLGRRPAASEVTGKNTAAPQLSAGRVPGYLPKPLGTAVSNYFPDEERICAPSSMACNSPNPETTQMSKNSAMDKYSIYFMENDTVVTARNMSELQLHVRTWMNLTTIMWSKNQDIQKVT